MPVGEPRSMPQCFCCTRPRQNFVPSRSALQLRSHTCGNFKMTHVLNSNICIILVCLFFCLAVAAAEIISAVYDEFVALSLHRKTCSHHKEEPSSRMMTCLHLTDAVNKGCSLTSTCPSTPRVTSFNH